MVQLINVAMATAAGVSLVISPADWRNDPSASRRSSTIWHDTTFKHDVFQL